MQTVYSGNTDGKFRAGEYEYDITLNTMFWQKSINDVSNLIFMNKRWTNKTIAFASIKEGSGPSQLERRDKTASVTVKGQNVGVPELL
jgi:HAE1 family hydrophobic/amphiphilic exporter-1